MWEYPALVMGRFPQAVGPSHDYQPIGRVPRPSFNCPSTSDTPSKAPALPHSLRAEDTVCLSYRELHEGPTMKFFYEPGEDSAAKLTEIFVKMYRSRDRTDR